ncbi:MAG: cytochrome b N-terminal domain-containing protein [Anaerolineae bacterium]|nr:cytochrome b N-terminal domain-containing protein [Anaerolineae bacterium]
MAPVARRRFLPILFLVLALILAASGILGGAGRPGGSSLPSPPLVGATRWAAPWVAVLPAAPAQDTCQTCHLSGEETNPWFPAARWLVFGAAGVIFAVGVWRSAYLWARRARWRGPWARLVDYLDHEYGIVEPIKRAWAKPAPIWPPRRWPAYLGGLTVLALLIQAATGVMLAFYYKPIADINPATGTSYAYESIWFIMNEVQFGPLVRSVHHWSADLTIILVVAHLARVFINRAYRAPHGSSWRWGVGLLVLALGFGFTGYLLPWDQKAFWATTVGSDIAGKLPVIGKPALLFLRDGWMVTGRTLQRFYGLHVFILPLLTIALLALHLRGRRFWSSIALRQARQWWVVLALVVAGAAVLMVLAPLTLEPPADPFDPPDSPKSAWYFLFIYQFLKYVPGTISIGGAPVITLGPMCGAAAPALLLILLALVPGLDRGENNGTKRRRRAAIVILCAAAWLVLTILGVASGV